jgi:hypothetical protein
MVWVRQRAREYGMVSWCAKHDQRWDEGYRMCACRASREQTGIDMKPFSPWGGVQTTRHVPDDGEVAAMR